MDVMRSDMLRDIVGGNSHGLGYGRCSQPNSACRIERFGAITYWSEIALDQLPAAFYTLGVTANDKAGGASASQRISFSVE
jgi:hypothetical protein